GDVGELNRRQIIVPEAFDYNPKLDAVIGDELEQRGWELEQLLQAHGWDFERMATVQDMARLRKEPISSMGFDRVLTVFSVQHPTLLNFSQQTLAEVTTPPIDPYGEGSALSWVPSGAPSRLCRGGAPKRPPAVLAEGSANPRSQSPLRQLELSSPVLSD